VFYPPLWGELRGDVHTIPRLLPRIRELKPDDLKAYLDGWSPHGPDALRW
jgi:hypothetical protein